MRVGAKKKNFLHVKLYDILNLAWARAQFEVTNVPPAANQGTFKSVSRAVSQRYVDVYHNNIMHCTALYMQCLLPVACIMVNQRWRMECGENLNETEISREKFMIF